MTEKRIHWYKIAEQIADIDWQTNNMAITDVEGKKITLIFRNGELSACTHKCPHAGGVLALGFVDALNNIVCPLHKYRFSVDNGRNTSGEGYYLKVYKVEKRMDGIYVGMEENGTNERIK